MKKKILIVDDQEDIRKSIIQGLKGLSKDYIFEEASDSLECLYKLNERRVPDLIIMDLMLTSTSGFELGSEIHRIKSLHSVPIIFLSAMDSDEVKEQAREFGSVFLPKPFDINNLHLMIKKIIKAG